MARKQKTLLCRNCRETKIAVDRVCPTCGCRLVPPY
ncbi:hypothetical protein [His 1 virus]|uniref:Uncharacterized protein ORF7 n=1 Tax=His1 virus (isolate Australia/Victoria) TaxID=654912 RepID=Y07_HIS1I|nr:hypothetical protein His1V_gp07 [His 1 virus]Q25BI8.1 RecName: Full=Uncharacterized protein ORF7 [His1 virus (isolate Victoria)]AAQ13726.1 hypothetical protein [His 1 virus]